MRPDKKDKVNSLFFEIIKYQHKPYIMKTQKLLKFFLVLFWATFSSVAVAQVSIGGIPYSFDHAVSKNAVTVEQLPALDVQQLRTTAAEKSRRGMRLQVGEIIETDFRLSNSGKWTDLPNGDRLWLLKIEVPGALGTSLYFDHFYIPEGSRLFVYNADKSQVIGAFTENNNMPHELFATEIVRSDTCIIEYIEPASVKGKGHFTISGVNHIFNVPSFVRTKDLKDSGDCNVNVNCPEGDDWQDQKKAVARYLIRTNNGSFLCTGTLVNNVRGDNKPYFLTAEHCGSDNGNDIFDQFVFYFNFEVSTCNGSVEPDPDTVTGCVRRAGARGSDFRLLEISRQIPEDYDVYYAGWDATGAGSPSGVGIHHPAGDVKKISTYTRPLRDENTHWRADWVRTQSGWGITEGGSSGSALFSNEGLIVGDETGGASYCDAPVDKAWDVYGKVSYSWTSNGSSASRQLKPWLDPDNTGTLKLQGKYPNSNPSPDPQVTITSPQDNAVYQVGDTVTITASVDSPGNIAIDQVEFFKGTTSLGTVSNPPYSYTTDLDTSGSQTIRVEATDVQGNTGDATVSITVRSGSDPNDITDLGGTIDAQYNDSPSGEEVDKAIDNSPQTKYLTFHSTGWVRFDAEDAYIVNGYSITSANDFDSRDPKDWIFEGSNNGSSWNTLHEVNDESFSERFLKKEYSFSNQNSYRYYRISITDNQGANIFQFAEWEIFGKPGGSERIDITDTQGTIDAQYTDSPFGEEVDKAIDNSASTKYLSPNSTGWVQYDAKDAYIVDGYSMTSANDWDTRDPKDWIFEGSNNGSSWTTLHEVNNESFSDRFLKKEYSFSNDNSYRYYRISITDNHGEDIYQFAELEIFGRLSNKKAGTLETDSSMVLYPNPIAIGDQVYLQSTEDQGAVVSVYTLDNKVVVRKTFASGEDIQLPIDFTTSKGLYLVEVKSSESFKKKYFKLVVQ